MLFAKIGKTFSPISGKEVKRHGIVDVTNYILSLKEDTRIYIVFPVRGKSFSDVSNQIRNFKEKGFTRIECNGKLLYISEYEKNPELCKDFEKINILVDRLKVKKDNNTISRINEAVEIGFKESNGYCVVKVIDGQKVIEQNFFSNKFEEDGICFIEPSYHFFSFNNPLGACPVCKGYGDILDYSDDLVFPNKNLSIIDDAIAPWRGASSSYFKELLIKNAYKFNFPVHKPIKELTKEQIKLLWEGNKYFTGLRDFFKMIEAKTYKVQARVFISRFRKHTVCPECKGTRLRKETSYVKINGKNIQELVNMELSALYAFFKNIRLDETEKKIAKHILYEINKRLELLLKVGLGYLTLNRPTNTLSGGESQRVKLANSIGSSLVGSLYILDEPSIGLHYQDTERLIKVLKELKDIGNTVVVVEHDEKIINAADFIIDLGPLAGRNGGEIVYIGTPKEMKKAKTLTSKYLNKKLKIPVPKIRRKWTNYISLSGATHNNLKLSDVTVKFPLNVITVITGVSGSGKSSLINDVLYKALRNYLNNEMQETGKFEKLGGDLHLIKHIEYIDQKPIGKSSRSNPVTYIKAYDDIRKLFAQQPKAQFNGFKPKHFSFNVEGGRCDNCKGEGIIKIDMQFMADVYLICDVCNGKRFKDEILEIKYRNKSISDVLEMTIKEAITFFSEDETNLTKQIVKKLSYLNEVGLGYLQLGQPSSTLSGGESQRIKLAYFLSKEKTDHTLFMFDEPTTGLHFYDIEVLIKALNNLIKRGHSIIIIEHNPEIIKNADWIIDLGPGGGKYGGKIVAYGTPEQVANNDTSLTGKMLKEVLEG